MLIDVDGNEQSIATVYIPNGKEGHFVKKVQEYQQENYRDTENPKNADLVNSIEDVSIALLESLWTDNLQLIPTVHSQNGVKFG